VATTPASPSWDFPRSTYGVLILCHIAGENGHAARAALAGTGLALSDLSRPDVEVAAGQELAVVRNVLRLLGDPPGLGARAGSRITLGVAGPWGFAMLNSRTTRQAIEIALRYGYGHFSFVFARPSVELSHNEVQLLLDTSELPHDVRDFLIERDHAAHLTLIPQLLGPTPVRVETTLGPDRARAIRAITHTPEVIADCGRDCVALPAGILDRRLPMADDFALTRWRQQCDELLARHGGLPSGTGIIGFVRAAILRDIAHPPTLEELASTLNLSSRTLRRQLVQAGTSFQALLDEVRRAAAHDLLDSGESVSTVATRVGYANTPAFVRAHRRWTGQTPGGRVNTSSAEK
jgi:AraC-like DNA-binding protein